MTLTDRQLPPPPDFDKPLPVGLRMSEEEFIAWYTFEGKAEWVDGEVILMSPIAEEHDLLQWWVRNLLQFYVQAKNPGEVRGPQFTARLRFGPDRRKISRREPDVLFVSAARRQLLKRTYLDGPPDIAFEIVSPGSQAHDYRRKYLEYESAGIAEYWIIDPLAQHTEAHTLVDGKYQQIADSNDQIKSTVLAGWYVRPSWLWREPRTDVLAALAELGVK